MHIRHDLKIFIPAQGTWYGGTSVLHAVALQIWLFWGFSLVAPKFLTLLAFFILTVTHSQQPTPHLEREHGLWRSLPDDLIRLCSSPKLGCGYSSELTFHKLVALAALKQALNLINKVSENGVLISRRATKEIKLSQEQICMYYM